MSALICLLKSLKSSAKNVGQTPVVLSLQIIQAINTMANTGKIRYILFTRLLNSFNKNGRGFRRKGSTAPYFT